MYNMYGQRKVSLGRGRLSNVTLLHLTLNVAIGVACSVCRTRYHVSWYLLFDSRRLSLDTLRDDGLLDW